MEVVMVVMALVPICSASLIMVVLCNRADHYIFILSFALSFYLFFPRLILAVADWMSAILPHMVWL